MGTSYMRFLDPPLGITYTIYIENFIFQITKKNYVFIPTAKFQMLDVSLLAYRGY